MYFYHPHTGRFEQSTRSSVRASTYVPSYSRRSLDDDALYLPYRASVLPHYSYDTSGSDYATQSDINRELMMSSAAMEDNYDITARSRQKDKDVLAAANRAIVDTEVHSTAKGAVAALRVARGHSTPPAKISRTEVHVAYARASPNKLRYSVPPASVAPRRPRYPRVTVNPRYRYWYPTRATRYSYSAKTAREPSPEIEGLRRAPLSLLAYLRNLEMALLSDRSKPRSTYVPVRSAYRKKAALLANKVEVNLPRKRHPKSSYAQARLRQMRRDKPRDDGDVETVVVADNTCGLKAHPPVRLQRPRRIWENELSYTSYRYTA